MSALESIKQAAREGATELDLSRLGLSTLPPEIGQLSQLTTLKLSGNSLSTLPPEIGQLSQLTALYLSGNSLSTLPPEIGQLSQLTTLNLGGNSLSTLPPEIGQLSQLTALYLSETRLSTLPPEIGQLAQLTTLDLSRNSLSTLPPEIGQLSQLTTLKLSGNSLSMLPPEIGQLAQLTTLDLRKTSLSMLPPEIGQLSQLTTLDLRKTSLSMLPPEIGQLSQLTTLDLRETSLSRLPPEIGQLAHRATLNLNLKGANLRGASLIALDLSAFDLSQVDLSGADLSMANLKGATIDDGTQLDPKWLLVRNLINGHHDKVGNDLKQADLSNACLREANFSGKDLSGADLRGSDLTGCLFVNTNLDGANLEGCRIYGISVWNLQGKPVNSKNLIATPEGEPDITVDDLEVAQFIYLLLTNAKIRNVIETVTTKVVLILGRFIEERKAVLDALRDELRKRNYIPVLFDFEKSENRSFIETVNAIANLARFVIADVTDPKVIHQELEKILSGIPSLPVQTILLKGAALPSVYSDFTSRQVLPLYEYPSPDVLLDSIDSKVIHPAEAKAKALIDVRVKEEMKTREINQNAQSEQNLKAITETAKKIQRLLNKKKEKHPDATGDDQKEHVNDVFDESLDEKKQLLEALQVEGQKGDEAFRKAFSESYVASGTAIVEGWRNAKK